jgi:hypothetical protein
MMKNNIVTIDWDDEILARTVLTMPASPATALPPGRPSRPQIGP